MHTFRLWAIMSMIALMPIGKAAGEEDYSIFQWQETRARFGMGADYFNVGSQEDAAPAISLRYRLSPEPWPQSEDRPWRLGPLPLNVWLEAGSILPHTGSSLRLVTDNVNDSTIDRAEVKLNWQGHLAVDSEFPIGQKRWLAPHIALGIAMASLKNNFDSQSRITINQSPLPITYLDGFHGDETHLAMSPYFCFGLNFFPDHVVSFHLSAAYVNYSNDFNRDFDYPHATQNSHAQTFHLSLSGWQIMPMLEIKLLWPSAVHIPLVPQALPPWLLPSYTTEPISPWVAPPGQASVGNVMFQYKNRWVEKVELIGEFNDWIPERMIKDRSGIWVLVKDLPPGKFRYDYLLDGKKEILDPWNKNLDPDSRTRGSSIVVVK